VRSVLNLDHIGKYRVVGKIGKGAMGEVYKAKDPLLNRFVALKTISPTLAADGDFKERFKREAQSAARLNHPNIITVYDYGEEQGLTYMVMELLEGVDLRQAIRSRSLGHLGRKLEVMAQILDGLAFAHANSVVHRDLKPGNIHLTPSGHVKILDFGLARLGASDMTKTGTVMGTPHYMSPEQVRGQKADARSDVFSLGSVFYELLCNHRPFEAESVHGVLLQILDHEPEPMRKWDAEVPAGLVEIVERALSKDAAKRYADAGEMLRALVEVREAIGGETMLGPGGAEQTMLQGVDATLLEPAITATHASVRGATALTLARTPARSGQTHLPQTVRPEPTLSGSTTAARRGGSSAWLVASAAVGALVVIGGAGLLLYRRSQPAPVVPQPAEVQQQQLGILTDALVTSQVELARTDLANHDYASAANHAEGALKLSSTNADAKDILAQAHDSQQKIDAAATEARTAYRRGDTAAAAEALQRVILLDSRNPVVDELSDNLSKAFRRQADDSRRQAGASRVAAEQARATASNGFAEGRQLLAAADTAFKREEFTAAAQKYEQSRIAFEAAKRETDEARAAAAVRAAAAQAQAQAQQQAQLRPLPTTRPNDAQLPPSTSASSPAPLAPTSAPSSSPLPAPSAALSPSPSLSPSASPYATLAPTAAAPAADAAQTAVRRTVFESYKRAIESQDIALFRSLKPDLTTNDEKALRESFKAIKSQVVGMTEESVQVDPGGERATVKVTRQDIVNGRPTPRFSQTFRLVRAGGSWQIQSMGQ
jgi:eukaryotic-like serine/threonine-protein kinase